MKQHLEITDLPQDTLGVLSGIRQPLVTAFNKSREYPYKMALLKAFLKFMYNRVVAFEKELEQSQAVASKASVIPENAPKIADTTIKIADTTADSTATKETQKEDK